MFCAIPVLVRPVECSPWGSRVFPHVHSPHQTNNRFHGSGPRRIADGPLLLFIPYLAKISHYRAENLRVLSFHTLEPMTRVFSLTVILSPLA